MEVVSARVDYRREVAPLGTAGGLMLIERPSEPILVINGDILTTLDFGRMSDFHRDQGASATIAAFPARSRSISAFSTSPMIRIYSPVIEKSRSFPFK